MNVVAEGVENQKIAERLKELGYDVLQGYLYSRPLPNTEFTEWFSSWTLH